MKKTTRELCKELNVPRTTFRDWVDKILNRKQDPTDKTALEFNEEEINKLWLVKFYKEMNYSYEQINTILNDPDFDVKESLTIHIKKMKEKLYEVKRLIKVATLMKDTGVTPYSMRSISDDNDMGYNLALDLMEMKFNTIKMLKGNNDFVMSENDSEAYDDKIFDIVVYGLRGLSYDCDIVQKAVKELHVILSKYMSMSVLAFRDLLTIYAPDTNAAQEIDNSYGQGSSTYLIKAIRKYCDINIYNEYDAVVFESLEKIATLSDSDFSIKSNEVQAEVDNLYKYIKSIYKDKEGEISITILRNLGYTFGSNNYIDILTDEAQQNYSRFISNSIKAYCEIKTKE